VQGRAAVAPNQEFVEASDPRKRRLKVLVPALVSALFAATVAVPAGASEDHLKVIGTDPAFDAPPGLDLTQIAVGRTGRDLEIRIWVEGMFPPGGGYPQVPGIQWMFKVRKRTFVAEAVATHGDGMFFLFEIKDGSAERLEDPEGTYDWTDGFIRIFVPLRSIGARRGTRIVGDREGGFDVDAHIHAFAQDVYVDTMTTDRGYVVP
jgi:hypothetical protein